jgi:Protein of unknown function (DUF1499)
MIPARLSIFSAVLAVLLVGLGVAGAHLGAIPPMIGFLSFLLGCLTALPALLFGLICLARPSVSERRGERSYAAAGIALSLLIAVPVGFTMWRWSSTPYPSIDDVTTDYDNPPEFFSPPGSSAGSIKYDRARLESIQSKYYPNLDPLRLDEKPDDAFARVKAAAHVAPLVGPQIADQIPPEPGWFIVYVNPATRTVEGVETSFMFRFRDDFVIQVRPGPGANTSLVEMRSRSRIGIGDFGANYNRIRDFFAILGPGGAAASSSS